MQPFKFRLQTKLDISSREEQQIREELQLHIILRDQLQRELDEINFKINEIQADIKDLMMSRFSLEQFLILKNYLPIIRNMQANKKEELVRAQVAIVEIRNILIEKIKERKILQKLREKEWINYLMERNREEQKIIDELAINNHFRKNISSI